MTCNVLSFPYGAKVCVLSHNKLQLSLHLEKIASIQLSSGHRPLRACADSMLRLSEQYNLSSEHYSFSIIWSFFRAQQTQFIKEPHSRSNSTRWVGSMWLSNNVIGNVWESLMFAQFSILASIVHCAWDICYNSYITKCSLSATWLLRNELSCEKHSTSQIKPESRLCLVFFFSWYFWLTSFQWFCLTVQI